MMLMSLSRLMLLTILSTMLLQRRNLSQEGCQLNLSQEYSQLNHSQEESQLNLSQGLPTSGHQIEPTTDKLNQEDSQLNLSQEDSQLNLSQEYSQLNLSQGLPTSGLLTLPTTGSPSSTTRTSRWSMAGKPSSRRGSLSQKLHLPEPQHLSLLLLLPHDQL